MKLFLIICAGSQIGGAIGPLPYDLKECHARRGELRTSQAQTIASGIHPGRVASSPRKRSASSGRSVSSASISASGRLSAPNHFTKSAPDTQDNGPGAWKTGTVTLLWRQKSRQKY